MVADALPPSVDFLGPDRRTLIVAIDHGMYSWPCRGLEDRSVLLEKVVESGADAVIASYGTIRDLRAQFRSSKPILKLDCTTVSVGEAYALTDYALTWTLEDAIRLGVGSVLTYIQLGTPSELEALRVAGRVAADCDRLGLSYLCEIMPVQSDRYPDPFDAHAIVASCRTAAEIGAHAVKTSFPGDLSAIADAVECGKPVIFAGGAYTGDRRGLLSTVADALWMGAAGVAFGRNVWGAPEPGAVVAELREIVHAGR